MIKIEEQQNQIVLHMTARADPQSRQQTHLPLTHSPPPTLLRPLLIASAIQTQLLLRLRVLHSHAAAKTPHSESHKGGAFEKGPLGPGGALAPWAEKLHTHDSAHLFGAAGGDFSTEFLGRKRCGDGVLVVYSCGVGGVVVVSG